MKKPAAIYEVAKALGIKPQSVYGRMHSVGLKTAGKSAKQMLRELERAGSKLPAAARGAAVSGKASRKSGNGHHEPVPALLDTDMDTKNRDNVHMSLAVRLRKALVILTPLYEAARQRAGNDHDTIWDLRFREAYKILTTGRDVHTETISQDEVPDE